MARSRKLPNRVISILGALALILVWWLDFGTVQPNRIVPGTGYGLNAAVGSLASAGLTVSLLALIVLARSGFRTRYAWQGSILTLLLVALPALLSLFAYRQLPADAPYARTAIGAGFWCLVFFLGLMVIEVFGRLRATRGLRFAFSIVVLAAWVIALGSGGLESLSIVREYATRPDQFQQALNAHLALSLGAVFCSLFIAFALAVAMTRRVSWRRPVLGTVSFLQTIPSLALFGLLIAPLSALSAAFPLLQSLGIRGIGWAPALIALIAYSLLPMVRNTYVALTEVSPALIEAGRAMGMGEAPLFFRVKLPLALPVIIEGMRVTTIQAIGLTAVAALIGADGFGTFIFQGLGQAAMDLVLLGALPTIALALAADALFSALSHGFRPAGLTDGDRVRTATDD